MPHCYFEGKVYLYIMVVMKNILEKTNPYEKYLYQSISAIYVPYMSLIISIGELKVVV